MVRVSSRGARAASAGASTAVARHREQVRGANEGKAAYKVVVEEKLQPRKKLLTSNYPEKEPPKGYTFVAAGNPQLTAKCKEYARQNGDRVYVVSTTKHQDTQLSMEVHRIGYHFPSRIVERAYIALGAPSAVRDRLTQQPKSGGGDQSGKKQHRKGMKRIDKKALKNLHQEEVNREARQAILDLFPAIPKDDLDVIINRAFDLGSKKVGAQVDDLSLPRRVQLAVVAHIRHVYTDYDNLLMQVPWMQARSMVEQACLEKLAQWRGSEEDDPDAMEEILQEVIVIPDDDDGDQDVVDASMDEDDRAPSAWRPGRQPTRPDAQMTHDQTFSGARTTGRNDSGPQDLGGGQYFVAQERPSRIERAHHHKVEAWRQAQTRVRDYRPAYPEAGFENTIPSLHQQPAMMDQAPSHYPHPQHRSRPSILTYTSNLSAASYPEPNDRQAVRPGVVSRYPPEIIPSIEPRTPRVAGPMEYVQSPREPEVVYVDYPDHDNPLRTRHHVAHERIPDEPVYIRGYEYRPMRGFAPAAADSGENRPMQYRAPRPAQDLDIVPITEGEWRATNAEPRVRGNRFYPLPPEMQSPRHVAPLDGLKRKIPRGTDAHFTAPFPGHTRRISDDRYTTYIPNSMPHRVQPALDLDSADSAPIETRDRPLYVNHHQDSPRHVVPAGYIQSGIVRREHVDDMVPPGYRRID